MRFEFATAGRVIFGAGSVREVRPADRTLVVTGASRPDLGWGTRFVVEGEPTVERVREGVQLARELGCTLVIGFGGGSAIDAGKAIAALAANPGDVLDYLEVVGRGQALREAPLHFVAVPTTAGTGSEVTRNAVLASLEHKVKASLRSPSMLPKVAIVDPELTLDLPPAVTAATGLDALTQLIEPYVSVRANAFTDALCIDGIQRAAQSLERAYRDGHDLDARTDMAYAALCGGMALANAGLGAVHGFAAPLGGMFEAPHGAVCAALLPHVMAVNIAAMHQRAPHLLERYAVVAQLLTNLPAARPEDGVEWVREIVSALGVPPLRSYGVTATGELIDKAMAASSMKANPIVLGRDELFAALTAAL